MDGYSAGGSLCLPAKNLKEVIAKRMRKYESPTYLPLR